MMFKQVLFDDFESMLLQKLDDLNKNFSGAGTKCDPKF